MSASATPPRGRRSRRPPRRARRRRREEAAAAADAAAHEALPSCRRMRSRHQLAAGRVAVVGRLRERSREDVVERRRQLGPHVGEPRRRLVQVREDDRELALAVERPLPGKALVEDAAERVDVGAAVDRAALDLLGRHVVDRADEAALAGQAARPRRRGGRGRSRRRRRARHRRLGATRMLPGFTSRWTSPAACAASRRRRPARRDRAPAPARAGPPRGAARAGPSRRRTPSPGRGRPSVLAGAERRDDVRMVEARRELRLAQEALPEPLVARQLRRRAASERHTVVRRRPRPGRPRPSRPRRPATRPESPRRRCRSLPRYAWLVMILTKNRARVEATAELLVDQPALKQPDLNRLIAASSKATGLPADSRNRWPNRASAGV